MLLVGTFGAVFPFHPEYFETYMTYSSFTTSHSAPILRHNVSSHYTSQATLTLHLTQLLVDANSELHTLSVRKDGTVDPRTYSDEVVAVLEGAGVTFRLPH